MKWKNKSWTWYGLFLIIFVQFQAQNFSNMVNKPDERSDDLRKNERKF